MSDLNSQKIIIPARITSQLQRTKLQTSGNCQVLEYLLPELCGGLTNEIKACPSLLNIDYYMLEETEQLLQRVAQACSVLLISKTIRFQIYLKGAALFVRGDFFARQHLSQSLNENKWIMDVFRWLEPNYIALAHSQELLDFSCVYEEEKHIALRQYRHFNRTNNGMECYIDCCVGENKAKLDWRVESPINNFKIFEKCRGC